MPLGGVSIICPALVKPQPLGDRPTLNWKLEEDAGGLELEVERSMRWREQVVAFDKAATTRLLLTY